MKGKILKISIATILIMAMTLTNFVYVALGIASYAVSGSETNHQNVEFNATIRDNSILELQVSVKNEGDFNDGTIRLEDSNFNLKNVQSEYIQQIDGNTISLNKINVGTIAKIEVPISIITDDTLNVDLLNKVSKVVLEGTYKNDKQKATKIQSTKEVKCEYEDNVTEENVEIKSEIITNKIVKVDGEDKRVVELSTNLGLVENNYPIEKINFKVNVLNKQNVETSAATKNITFNTMTHYDYNYDGSNFEVSFTNEPNEQNNIVWKKQGNEKVVITLIYDKDVDVNGLELNLEEKVTLYNQKELTTTNKVVVDNEEKNGIIQIGASNTESSIYKGKLYYRIDKNIESKTEIAVNLAKTEEGLKIREESTKYVLPNGEAEANVVYNQTKISKSSFDKIFGEQGRIVILNQNGEVIARVDSSTEVDENQNIVIDYAGKEPTSIEIQTSMPIAEGNIKLTHSKTIKAGDRNIIKSATDISTKVNYNNNVANAKTTLKETSTEATIEMRKQNLSTLETNNVEISAILKSSSEKNDLYKNPKIQIILPSDIEDITVNGINKLNSDEVQITKAELGTVAGVGKVINIELAGEQTAYTASVSKGIQIIINADITFSKLTPTKEASLVMKYTNENGSEASYETSSNFNIVSKYGLLTYSKVTSDETIESIGNEPIKIDLGIEEKEVTIERNIINNYESDIENVSIVEEVAEIATIEKIATNIETSKIYYLTDNNEDWQETVDDISKIKAYKIEIPNSSLAQGQVLKILEKVKISGDVEYNKTYSEKLNVSYKYGEQTSSEEYAVEFKSKSTITKNIKLASPLAQENVDGIGKLRVVAIAGGEELKDGDEINEGQTVKVQLSLTNNTGNTLKNVKITAKQENAIFYNEEVTQEMNTLTLEDMDVTYYKEDENVKQKEFTVDELPAGKNVTFEYEYSVKEMPGKETKGTITLTADDKEEQTISTLNNKIKDADLKVNLFSGNNLEVAVNANEVMVVDMRVKNISDKELKNVKVEIPLSEYMEGTPELFNDEGNITFEKVEDGVAIFNISSIKAGETEQNYITFEIADFEEKEVDIKLSAIATANNQEYVSNELSRKGYQLKADISAEQKGSIEEDTVKSGDKITYTTTIKNNEQESQVLEIYDEMQSEVVIQKAYIVKDGEQIDIDIDEEENSIDYEVEVAGNGEVELVIETEVFAEIIESNEISNIVGVSTTAQYLESNEVKYKLVSDKEEDTENPEEDVNGGNGTTGGNGSGQESSSKGAISGAVWLDSNKNGQKDSEESILNNIEVRLLNVDTGEIYGTTKTDNGGNYTFNDINSGKYIVLMKYDTQKYSITEYKKSGVSEEVNSNVISETVNGEKLAITDELEINGNTINNLNAGLVENKIFDLSLNKYINKITVQNAEGTKVTQYNKEQIAKVELSAKQIAGSTVIVEYGIEITNEGEIAGYASEIIDYLPDDYKFNSEMNKDWYVSTDKQLHSNSLANEIINPGESKTITLILTKTMTENNTGTSINTAEIAKTSNSLAIEDKDSTPGNKVSGEDDMSEARVIVSIKTGTVITTGIIVMMILVPLMILEVRIIKKRGDINEKFDKKL